MCPWRLIKHRRDENSDDRFKVASACLGLGRQLEGFSSCKLYLRQFPRARVFLALCKLSAFSPIAKLVSSSHSQRETQGPVA